MHCLARTAALFLLFPFPALAVPVAAPAIASESQITVTGNGVPGETYSLPRINGDWFATGTDAHASLTLRTAAASAHQVQLGIEWDGTAQTQSINANKSSGVGETIASASACN